MSYSMFNATWYSSSAKKMVTHHKPNRDIYPILADLSKKKEELIHQKQELTQKIQTIESNVDILEIKRYIDWLENQGHFFRERLTVISNTINSLVQTDRMITIKLWYDYFTRLNNLKNDIVEMNALLQRRKNEFNLSQVEILTKRIEFAYNKIVSLNEKIDINLECHDSLSQTINDFKAKYSTIEDCVNSIEFLIKKNKDYIKHNNDEISCMSQQISSIDKKINEIDENIRLSNIAITENNRYYAKRREIVCRNIKALHNQVEAYKKEEEAKRKQCQKREAEMSLHIMDREEDELTKTIEEEERKLAENKKKLLKMRAKNAKQRALLGY